MTVVYSPANALTRAAGLRALRWFSGVGGRRNASVGRLPCVRGRERRSSWPEWRQMRGDFCQSTAWVECIWTCCLSLSKLWVNSVRHFCHRYAARHPCSKGLRTRQCECLRTSELVKLQTWPYCASFELRRRACAPVRKTSRATAWQATVGPLWICELGLFCIGLLLRNDGTSSAGCTNRAGFDCRSCLASWNTLLGACAWLFRASCCTWPRENARTVSPCWCSWW